MIKRRRTRSDPKDPTPRPNGRRASVQPHVSRILPDSLNPFRGKRSPYALQLVHPSWQSTSTEQHLSTTVKMGAGASKAQPGSEAPSGTLASGAEKLQVCSENKNSLGGKFQAEQTNISTPFICLSITATQQLNRTMTNRLEDHTPLLNFEKSDDVSLPRQQFLDSSIQGKIREELSKLRKQEADVRQQIEHALEKENLDAASQSSSKGAKGKSSIILHQELDDVRAKIEKHNQRKTKVEKAPGVKQAREKVLSCYK
jgi:hypothetical protein